jgi:hypothetical protein
MKRQRQKMALNHVCFARLIFDKMPVSFFISGCCLALLAIEEEEKRFNLKTEIWSCVRWHKLQKQKKSRDDSSQK